MSMTRETRGAPDAVAASTLSRTPVHCTFEGCPNTSLTPLSDGWASLAAWGPGIPDGMYCREHAAAIEACYWDILAEQEKLKRRSRR